MSKLRYFFHCKINGRDISRHFEKLALVSCFICLEISNYT